LFSIRCYYHFYPEFAAIHAPSLICCSFAWKISQRGLQSVLSQRVPEPSLMRQTACR